MKNVIAGTAGHIDHGKTTLVRALTGIDTDRLEEEKRRGISIDLGFAHLKLADSLRVAFIDVPGHERFIKNMLAGVGGIDLVMLVVAADESVKPQTREHFEICRLLHIPRGVVALTKTDSVDPEIVQLARLEVEEFLAGSFLEGAPVVPVSAATGAGLPELKQALERVAREVPERSAAARFRMPVDRSFVVQGFGTVVTGTVISGSIAPDEEVEIHPGERRVRVRGIQVHDTAARRVSAGQRAAINLAGIETADIGRGSVLAAPGAFQSTTMADCILELLPGAKPLKNRAPVHFHAGTTEVVAEVRVQNGGGAIQPGTRAPVRLLFREPLLVMPGDRFITRKFSPVTTIGGGVVVDPFPPAKMRRGTGERTLRLSTAPAGQRIAQIVAEHPGGLSSAELTIRTGLSAQEMANIAPEQVLFVPDPQPWFVEREWLSRMAARWHAQLKDFHRANPLLPGMPREELRSRELGTLPGFLFNLILAQDRALASTGDVVHLAAHRLAFQVDEERALQTIEDAFRVAGLAAPGVKQVLDSSGVDAGRAKNLLQILLRSKRLVRISEDLILHPDSLSSLRKALEPRRGTRFSVGDFKEWTGISRKYAIPLLEFLDREHITHRDGDTRLVL